MLEHRKANSYTLKNARLRFKAFSTLGILASLVLLAVSWRVSFDVLKINRPSNLCVLLGDDLWALSHFKTGLFVLIFFLQAAAYAGMYGVARILFVRTYLRRRLKALLLTIATLLILADQLVWLSVPLNRFAQQVAGYLGMASAAFLVALAILPLYQMWFFKRWPNSRPTRVVVVGGGFAGLYAALGLDNALGYHDDLEIVLVDKKNFFLFPPLLPSAAVGTIETRQVTYSFRRIFETTNVRYEKATVIGVDPKAKTVTYHVHLEEDETGETSNFELAYDYLVLAPGSTNQTFNTKGAAENAFFVKELTDAIKIRNRIIDCFERASVVGDENIRRELLRFAVVGGGPTGIEIATEVRDLIHEVLLKRYPDIDPTWPEVTIIQSGTQVLPGWPDKIVQMTTRQLARLGVNLVLNNRVMEVRSNAVVLRDGPAVQTRTILWCAGVQPSPLLKSCGIPLDKSGRIEVDEYLRPTGFSDVFVLGDSATCLDGRGGKPLPPLGQVAFQQGDYLANALTRTLLGKPVSPFKYTNFGALVSVGEHYAAVDLLGVKLSGVIGWFVWRTLYLGKIVGFSNKLRIVVDWTLDLLIERSISQLQEPQESVRPAGPPTPANPPPPRVPVA